MAVLKVVQMGQPVLRERAAEVTEREIRSGAFRGFVDDMVETMRDYAGVGLAAPQVNVGKRVAVIEARPNTRYPDAPELPLQVLINPVLTPLTDELGFLWEGCLSIPGIRGLVNRPKRIRVQALDPDGNPVDFEAEGFHAIVIQHETDHLDGILFIDRMKDLRKLAFQKEYERFFAEPDEDEGDDAAPAERSPD